MKTNPTKRLRPRWSLATSFWFCTGAIVVVVPAVLLTIRKSIWVELEIVTGVLAALMFAYFSVLLHHGVRFDDSRRAIVDWPKSSPSELVDCTPAWPETGLFTEAGSEAGCLGMIVGVLLDIVVMVALAFLISWLLWVGANAVVAVVLFLYWVHCRWLRHLVTRGRHCRGNWKKSILHGGATTVLYSFWFYTAFFVAQKISDYLHR